MMRTLRVTEVPSNLIRAGERIYSDSHTKSLAPIINLLLQRTLLLLRAKQLIFKVKSMPSYLPTSKLTLHVVFIRSISTRYAQS